MTTQSDFKNFAVFTVDIRSVEQKTSKEGKPYAIANAVLPMEDDPMPLRIVALDGIAASIVTGQLTLVGRLGYDEKDGKGTAKNSRSCSSRPKSSPPPAMGSCATTST